MAPAAAPRGLLGTRNALPPALFALLPPPSDVIPLFRGRHAAVMIAGRIMFYVGVVTAVTEMLVAARSPAVIASYFSRPRAARFDKHTCADLRTRERGCACMRARARMRPARQNAERSGAPRSRNVHEN